VFWRQGFSATSINDLLSATGMTKGSLYFHFPGKEEIGLVVLRQERDRFLAFVDASLIGNSPGAALDSLFHGALTQHRSKRFVGGCLFGNTALIYRPNSWPNLPFQPSKERSCRPG
jgi:TetR/AcrR family transcriptional repressor of nem operon